MKRRERNGRCCSSTNQTAQETSYRKKPCQSEMRLKKRDRGTTATIYSEASFVKVLNANLQRANKNTNNVAFKCSCAVSCKVLQRN
jgi:hypothetical protein